MQRCSNFTSAGLLDHVEARLRRDPGRGAPDRACAYLADGAGRVAIVAMPAPACPADAEALGAILGAEMRERSTVLAVLQFPAGGEEGGLSLTAIGPEGEELGTRFLRRGFPGQGAAAPRDGNAPHRP